MVALLTGAIGLLFVMLGTGALTGLMINISLGQKFYDLGGILGGALVGFIMYMLGGGPGI